MENQEKEPWEGKNILEVLGIDKDDDWVVKQHEIGKKILSNNSEPLINMVTSWVIKENQELALMILKAAPLGEKMLNDFTTLFFHLGYMKGKQDKETDDTLERMWSGDKS